MKSMIRKTTVREIRKSFGRFFAIFAIVALGVGFFSGLKVSKQTMLHTGNRYISEQNLFDFRLLSTIGFNEEEVEAFSKQTDILQASGAYTTDILYLNEAGNESVLKVHSITPNINELSLTAGRLPETAQECIVDNKLFSKDSIGTKIKLSDTNSDETKDFFSFQEYTITGIVSSPYYINFERGNTSIGNGKISGFVYLLPEAFHSEYYTEVFLKFNHSYEIYSKDYKTYLEEKKTFWEEFCKTQVQKRYDTLLKDATQEWEDAKTELEDKKNTAQRELDDALKQLEEADLQIEDGKTKLLQAQEQLNLAKAFMSDQEFQAANKDLIIQKETLETVIAETEKGWKEYHENNQKFQTEIADAQSELEDAKQEIDTLTPPDIFVLDRSSNIGYVCFENDSDIVEGIADVFPVFFFLVAALVCITTMNRMVEEQRVQIGVLKALGYNSITIMGKYMFYSGSAALCGCIFGFFVGTFLFPNVIWQAYRIMYDLPDLEYVFNPILALISLFVAMFCSVGATWFSCRYELRETPSNLLRPKTPKAGKRIFLEKIPFLWKRFKFLHKVTMRNIFRYKKRFFMMVVGISGCTALLVTGFGVRDSIADVAKQQFEEIQIYDGSINFQEPQDPNVETEFTETAKKYASSYTYTAEKSIELLFKDKSKEINLVIVEDFENTEKFLNLHRTNGSSLKYPELNSCIISHKIAKDYKISEGDTIRLRDGDLKEIEVRVGGIFENFVYNYIYLRFDTYQEKFGQKPEYKSTYINFSKDQNVHQAAAEFMKLETVSSVAVNEDMKERITTMMSSLNYIVALVIACAAFLAFIVLYNLTNINITERIREIATIKVLGFYKKETASYVFRENIVLTAIGGIVGLPLGKALHSFVMSQVNVELISFDVHITFISYLLSIIFTFFFAFCVNLFMTGKLEKINMAESLKSVD